MPPSTRMRSRPEISVPMSTKSGAVSPTSHDSIMSSPTRMNIARNRPMRRAFSRCSGPSRSTRMEMKMMLSMPSTSSSAVNVKNAIQACGSVRRASMASMNGGHIRGNQFGTKTRYASRMRQTLLTTFFLLSLLLVSTRGEARLQSGEVHVWELEEITLATTRDYANPYTEVECWVELEGPDFHRRVYGFWDGGRTFKVR